MSDDFFADRPFPRKPLLGAVALVGFALLAGVIGRVTGIGTTSVPESVPEQRLSLRFQDQPNGAIAVYRAANNHEVATLDPGTNGFVRGVLRGLARERKLQGVGPRPPFTLTRWADGRLSLSDPETGRRVELDPFGATNVEAFARLFRAGAGPQGAAGQRSGLTESSEIPQAAAPDAVAARR